MENILDIILADTFVKNTALKRLAALKDHLLTKVFSENSSPPAQTRIEDPELSLWILKISPNYFVNLNAQNIYEVFADLEKNIKACEPLVIYLPYELPQEQIAQIGQKLRANFGKNFLMEIQIDPSLIAGCSLSYKGIYKDTSVKQRIADNQKEILAIFRKYIKH